MPKVKNTSGKNRLKTALAIIIAILLVVLAAGLLYRLTGGGGDEPVKVEEIELDKESIIFGGGG